MLVFAIVVLALETLFSGIVVGITQGGTITYEFAMFTIFFYAVCTICAIIALIMNIKALKDWLASKPKAIVGTILSSIAILYGVIFFASLIAGIAAA